MGGSSVLVKGYGNLAYILKDSAMIAETRVWIEAAIASQREDGYFGPVNERNGRKELWANMVMLWCMRPTMNILRIQECWI